MKEEVTFVDIEAWGRTAELVGQYLTKGRACFVEGRLERLDSWDDKKDGQKRSKLKVIADNVQFIDSNRDRGQGGAPGEAEMADAGESSAAVPASSRVAKTAPQRQRLLRQRQPRPMMSRRSNLLHTFIHH